MTRQQRGALQTLLRFYESDPTPWQAFWSEWRILLGNVGILTVGVLAALVVHPVIPAVVVAAVCGSLASDLGKSIARARIWPVTKQVIDWDEVRRLLEEDSLARSQANAAEDD